MAEPTCVGDLSGREWAFVHIDYDIAWALEFFGYEGEERPRFCYLHCVRDANGDVYDYDQLWASDSIRLDAPVRRLA